MSIEMYRIREEDVKIKVTCERCSDRGIVDKHCHKCGGNGAHNKTLKVWKVAPKTTTVNKIDRASKDSYYKEQLLSSEGELRYWTSMNDYYPENSRYLHFTNKDAQTECDRRNKDIADILKIYDKNHDSDITTCKGKIQDLYTDTVVINGNFYIRAY